MLHPEPCGTNPADCRVPDTFVLEGAFDGSAWVDEHRDLVHREAAPDQRDIVLRFPVPWAAAERLPGRGQGVAVLGEGLVILKLNHIIYYCVTRDRM